MLIPILTVVMPTHNRASYAISAINSILSFPDPDIELVVTDTSDNYQLRDAVSSIQDNRLNYSHIDSPLSMTENYNLAMTKATGVYVCLIGDDDTITADAISVSRWANVHKIGVVSPLVVANYAWPDFKSRFFGNAHAGRLYIKKKFGDFKWCDSKVNLKKSLKKGALGTEGLPKVYHSIVSKNLMNMIKDKSGDFFHGVSPDVSGAVGLALVCDKYLEIDYPLTLPGAAGNSNSGRSAMNTHKGSLAEDSHTKRFKNLKWPNLLPQFTSVETVWAQAAYSTLKSLDADLLKEYNFLKLYAVCYLRHWDKRTHIDQSLAVYKNERNLSRLSIYMSIFFEISKEIVTLIFRYGKRLLTPTAAGGRGFVGNIQDIHEAQLKLEHHVENNNQVLSEILRSSLTERL